MPLIVKYRVKHRRDKNIVIDFDMEVDMNKKKFFKQYKENPLVKFSMIYLPVLYSRQANQAAVEAAFKELLSRARYEKQTVQAFLSTYNIEILYTAKILEKYSDSNHILEKDPEFIEGLNIIN